MFHRRIFFSLFFILVLLESGINLNAQHLHPDIQKAFKTGDADLLARHFNARISLNILNKEYDPSQAQAKEIMRDFFRSYPPIDFRQKFESEKKDSKFVIAILHTSNGAYRVNIFFRNVDGKDLVHLLRIEKEDESAF